MAQAIHVFLLFTFIAATEVQKTHRNSYRNRLRDGKNGSLTADCRKGAFNLCGVHLLNTFCGSTIWITVSVVLVIRCGWVAVVEYCDLAPLLSSS